MKECRRTILSACLLFLLTAAIANAEVSYTVTDLGTLGGAFSIGIAINSTGQCTGWSDTASGASDAFRYSAGVMSDLGTLGGTVSYGFGINDAGQVVGSDNTSGSLNAVLYSGGTITSLGTLEHAISEASDINNAGTIVGYTGDSNLSEDSWHAFTYSGVTMTDLNALLAPGSTNWTLRDAWGINSSGVITGGGIRTGDTATRAYIYIGGAVTDLGNLGGTYAYGMDLNDAGQVVGSADLANGSGRGFVWDAVGGMTNLGTLGGDWTDAYGVNASGSIVGEADNADGQPRAFLYKNGTMIDLNSLIDPLSGWTLQYAEDINDAGWIVGMGVINGQEHAMLLTPMAPLVPEPAAVLILSIGLAGLLVRQRRE